VVQGERVTAQPEAPRRRGDKQRHAIVSAVRELLEETGVRWDDVLTQVGAYGDPGRDPRGWTVSVAWTAHVGDVVLDAVGGDDAADAEWHAVADLPDLAFDHNRIVSDALDRVQSI